MLPSTQRGPIALSIGICSAQRRSEGGQATDVGGDDLSTACEEELERDEEGEPSQTPLISILLSLRLPVISLTSLPRLAHPKLHSALLCEAFHRQLRAALKKEFNNQSPERDSLVTVCIPFSRMAAKRIEKKRKEKERKEKKRKEERKRKKKKEK